MTSLRRKQDRARVLAATAPRAVPARANGSASRSSPSSPCSPASPRRGSWCSSPRSRPRWRPATPRPRSRSDPSTRARITVGDMLAAAAVLLVARGIVPGRRRLLGDAASRSRVWTATLQRLLGSFLNAGWPLQASQRHGRLQELITDYATFSSGAHRGARERRHRGVLPRCAARHRALRQRRRGRHHRDRGVPRRRVREAAARSRRGGAPAERPARD